MHDQSEGPIILAAFANDHRDAANFLRNLSEEAQRMQAALEPARQLCPLVLLPDATLDEILDAFQKYRDRVVVFHFAGHANGFELLLESATGGVHRIGAQGLASFLGQQQGLQLVFLNGCSTEGQAEDLLNAGVGCVIATTQSIDDAVATEFSARFYKGIVTGAPLQSAYAEATGSAQASSGGSIDRLIRRKEETAEPHVASRWPWLLKFKPGAERVAQWSLPEAAGDPLFGLPSVPQRDLPESPYRHLFRFEAEHAEVFFGRGHEIRELYQRVTASDAAPVVLFYGPSGVGKSSLLDAGLIPRLAGKNEVRYVRRDPALGLGESLRLALPKETHHLSRREAWIAAEKSLGRPLVIVLDQVEEVFTKPHPQQPHELAEFVQLLRRIFFAPDHRPQGKLILGFRKEWFAEIDELLADAQVPRSRIFLERLSRDGVIEAITGPVDDLRLASQYQLKIEDGLSEVIADDLLADPDTPVAPTLQILLTRMWSEATRRNREQPTFDAELYQSLHRNGILLDDFLRQQTEQIHARLPRAVDSGFLLDLLEFHTTAIGTSAEHPLSVLEAIYAEQAKSGILSQTLALCEELYLLTFSGPDAPAQPPDPGPLPPSHIPPELPVARGGEGAETHRSSRLLHDTLAPLIRARHEESDLPGQRARRILDNRSVDWLDGQTGIPLDVTDLKEVEAALEGTRSWSADEQRLVAASREERASNRRWRRIFKGLGVAAVVLISISAAVAYWQMGLAQNASQQAVEKARQARRELASSERRQAITSRDLEQLFVKSSHHFAAAAAASDDPAQAASMSFAAGRSIYGLELVNQFQCPDLINDVWLLENGALLSWSTSNWPEYEDHLDRWTSSGEQLPLSVTDQKAPPEQASLWSQVRMSANQDRMIFSSGSQLMLGKRRDTFVEMSPAELVQGIHYSEKHPERVLMWNDTTAIVFDTNKESASMIPCGKVDGARMSESGQRVLTWTNNKPAALWTLRSSDQWTAIELPARPIADLSPDFLGGSEKCLIWRSGQVDAADGLMQRGDGSRYYEVISAQMFSSEGIPSGTLTLPPPLPHSHPGYSRWSHSASSEPTGYRIVLLAYQSAMSWTCTGTAAPMLPEGTFHFSDYLNDVRIAPHGQSLAIWSSNELFLGGRELRNPDGGFPAIRIASCKYVQDAIYSQDGTKLLVWTAKEKPRFGSGVSSRGNTPGIVQVFETSTGLPLTAPIQLSKAFRGAKFVNNDREFLAWGEDGMLQHWRITSQPSTPATITEDSTDAHIVNRNEPEIRSTTVDPDRVQGVRPLGQGAKQLEWGGHTGGVGQIPGGYACLREAKRLLTPIFRHERNVSTAACDRSVTRVLTSTSGNPLNPDSRMTAHLWDVTTAIELMEPLAIHGTKSTTAQFSADEGSLIVFGAMAGPFQYHISPDPALDRKDPRIDIVTRTGTYLDQFGDLKTVPPESWRLLKSLNTRPTYDEWFQSISLKP